VHVGDVQELHRDSFGRGASRGNLADPPAPPDNTGTLPLGVFVQIRNAFRIPVPPDQAWQVLNDLPRVARCAPGAQLLEQREDGAVGTVAVRLGPVALSFKGTFTYKERDEAAHRVVAEAAGNEAKARGTARAQVMFQLSPDGDGTKVDVESDVQLAGPIAQYGRGAALIQSTAQAIIDQFAANLAKQIQTGAATPEPPPAPAPTAQPEQPIPAQPAPQQVAPVAAATQPDPVIPELQRTIAELQRTIAELQRGLATLGNRVMLLETPQAPPVSAFAVGWKALRNTLFPPKT
jgi:uncharacterized protein